MTGRTPPPDWNPDTDLGGTNAEVKGDGLALVAAATEEQAQYGVVLVALPAADDPVHDIGPEEKHATLLYFGDLPGGDNPNERIAADDGFRTLLSQCAAIVAAETAPFDATVAGVESLGDEGARVWMLDDDTLAGIRDEVQEVDSEVTSALEAVEQYPTYTPHSTIGYPAEGETMLDEDTEAAAAEVTSIRYDRLALWWGGEQTEWPLQGGTEQEDDMSTTDTEAAALVAAARVIAPRLNRSVMEVAGMLRAQAAGFARTGPVTAAAGDPAPVIQEMDSGDPAPVIQDVMDPWAEMEALGDQFYGVMTVEDSQTGDGRVFLPGSIVWDDVPLPMPIGWQVQDAPGHDGAVICGRIDTIFRIGNLIAYTGTWDLDGAGWETRRLVFGQFLTGVSVDTDDTDVTIVTEDGQPVDPWMMMPDPDQTLLLAVTEARVRSFAMCRVPAFTEGFIANGTPPAGWNGERPGATVTPEGEEEPTEAEETPAEEVPTEEEAAVALVAAALSAGNPAAPYRAPAGHFTNPGLTEPTNFTVGEGTPETGYHVFGHLAVWGVCHIGISGQCIEPPASASNYAYFAKGSVPLDDGTYARTGRLTIDTGHADLRLGLGPAAAHYDNTGAAFADVTIGQDDIGIWFSGHTVPGVTDTQVYNARAAGAVSGDWREAVAFTEDLELVAALVVNVPGFPIPAPALAASGAGARTLVAAGMVATRRDPVGTARVEVTLDNAEAMASQVETILHRRQRARAATARLRADRARTALSALAADRAARVAKAAAQITEGTR